jgi:hypothetical protein
MAEPMVDTPDDESPFPVAVAFSYLEIAELQDQLLEASTDLERLTGLLAHAVDQLLTGFGAAHARLESGAAAEAEALAACTTTPQGAPGVVALVEAIRGDLGDVVTALQFQDMASQLITHSVKRIRAVADLLGSQVMPEEGDTPKVELVTRHTPVAQREMDAGSVELF